MTTDKLTKLSKFLSLVLRHKPEEIGLELDAAGWANVDALLSSMQQHGIAITIDQLVKIVDTDEKSRYQFSPDRKHIRASQGHSLEVDLGYQPQQPPDVLYHGTASRFLESIQRTGLEKRNRHHVHLSASPDVAAAVGKRHGVPVILVIDAARMNRDGCIFYRSENNVWLTEEVPVRYISFPDLQ
jgi:putative RNA 2'-phosphotransferase